MFHNISREFVVIFVISNISTALAQHSLSTQSQMIMAN